MTAQLVLQILNMIDAGFTWLTQRGINQDRIQIMLDAAKNGDLTTEQVQAELDTTAIELDATGELIDETFDPSD